MKLRHRRRRAARAASAAFWPSGAGASVTQREAMRGITLVHPSAYYDLILHGLAISRGGERVDPLTVWRA